MYCGNCGSDNDINASYCSKCGCLLDGNVSAVHQEYVAQSRRQELVKKLNALYNIFVSQKDRYDKISSLNMSIARLDMKNSKITWLVLSIVLPVLLGLPIISTAYSISPETMGAAGAVYTPDRVDSMRTTALFVGVVLCLPAMLTLVMRGARVLKIKRYKHECGVIYNELIDHYKSVNDSFVSFEFSDPYSLNAIRAIVSQGKADSVKEAIDKMEQAQYRSSVLNLQGHILEQCIAIKNATRAAAFFAGVAAFASVARR